jgi:hypothetical protein
METVKWFVKATLDKKGMDLNKEVQIQINPQPPA